MTKETYFEMCEALGSEPIASEVPVILTDLPLVVQEAFFIYFRLTDVWEGMNGTYMGKQLIGIKGIFEILNVPVEDHKTMLELILMIDKHRSKVISDNQPKGTK